MYNVLFQSTINSRKEKSVNEIEISALVSMVLVTAGTVWYIMLGVNGIKVQPVLASWIVTCGSMTLSFFTYLTSPNASVVKGACNGISVLTTGAILVLSFWMGKKKSQSIKFTPFQKFSLWTACAIALLWVALISKNGTGIVPNILTQILILIGYVVTCQKLWYANRNTESLFCWWCIVLAALVALYTGIISNDSLVILYAGRTLFGTGILLALMYRAERKMTK